MYIAMITLLLLVRDVAKFKKIANIQITFGSGWVQGHFG